jgi:hypothetical protein
MQIIDHQQQAELPGNVNEHIDDVLEDVVSAAPFATGRIQQRRPRLAQRAQDLHPGPVRRSALALQARAPGRPYAGAPGTPDDAIREGGLARTRITLYQHQSATARANGSEPAIELREFATAPDESSLSHGYQPSRQRPGALSGMSTAMSVPPDGTGASDQYCPRA